jgi:hypothetical protein
MKLSSIKAGAVYNGAKYVPLNLTADIWKTISTQKSSMLLFAQNRMLSPEFAKHNRRQACLLEAFQGTCRNRIARCNYLFPFCHALRVDCVARVLG